jgi:DNA-directed RNA polymerase subunit RPC12/RpoP
MPRSDCPYCGRNVRKAYTDEACPECQGLIDLKERKLKDGSLCLPDYSGHIGERIPLVPVMGDAASLVALPGRGGRNDH